MGRGLSVTHGHSWPCHLEMLGFMRPEEERLQTVHRPAVTLRIREVSPAALGQFDSGVPGT